MNKILTYIIIVLLTIVGLLLVFGELEQYNTLTFIVTKGIGMLALYIVYEVYKMNKLTWLDSKKRGD